MGNLSENISYFDWWSKTYDRHWTQFWMRRFQDPTLEEIQYKAGIKILDISCGTGILLQRLRERSRGKAALYGLDLSTGMLAMARKRLPEDVTLLPGDVHALPFIDAEFDYVLCTEAFHHYHSQRRALAEMQRVVKTEGKVIIADINFFLKPIHWLFQRLEPGCVKVNSRKEMRRLLERNGLTVVRQKRNFAFAVMTVGEKKR